MKSFVLSYPLTLLITAITLVAAMIPSVTARLQLDMAATLDGQWWRVWTGHTTHYDGSHLFYDCLMFVVLSAWLERQYQRLHWIAVLLMMPIISVVIWATCPDITVYRGLSGLDTGLFVALAGSEAIQAWGRSEWKRAGAWSVPLIGLIGKLIYESISGDTLFVDSSGFRPLVQSHIAGAVCGLVYAVACGIERPCNWYTYRKTSATA